MKALKWLLAIVASVILLLVIYLTVFFDPNSFKPQIVDAVKKQTGRDFVISQDLSWSFFPTLGINLGGISLSNPENFSPSTLVEVNQAVASVALMPLLSQQVEIAQLSLDGLTMNIVTKKDGSTSFDGLGGAASPETTIASEPASSANTLELQSLQIGGVSITNTTINVIDEAAETKQIFSLNSLTLGEFSLGNAADFAYEFTAQMPDMMLASSGNGQLTISEDLTQVIMADLTINTDVTGEAIPNKSVSSQLITDINVALDAKKLDVAIKQLSAMDISATGDVSVNYGATIPKINLQLDVGDIDVDKLLPPSETKAKAEDTEQVAASKPAVEPDLSALKTIDLTLGMTVKSIKVANLLTQNWVMKAKVKDGVADLTQFSANLYEGSIKATAQLDGRQKVASYRFDETLTGVQFRPLLKDAADIDLISGAANFKISGSGKSLIPDNLKKNLLAQGNFEIADGSLYGVNIPQMIRSAQDKLKGDLSAKNTEELKTDFTSLTGSFSLKNAVATNPDLAMASPLIRLSGNGSANIDNETVDYKLTTSVVGSLAGQGGEDALAGVDIPLTITGSMKDPKFGIDTSALLDSKLKDETDKLKGKLFKKLGF
ncbi:AsmA family protein [Shewanella sp. 10N.286.48.A6]|uniref:AsmA family protein n=1 Tax=Shewanella sp. 10N.286.48.A6 TaxID=1880833 RepID=UPI000C8366A6|nr:AsmA family protein [Shewanella sp. 10N.286.48.A6]PMI00522.1 cell envelope biogenesis protein AsmA [Shewanella sp. 10N.286.48.A6]